jgi:predicted ATP-grasp superfamily ATP-dependent carboligase
MPHADLIIVGASARAAAFSALRAEMRPWCADLFADADLRARCPAMRLNGRYPEAFEDLLASAPLAPWIYTGGLENHPRLVSRMAQTRPLWGNDSAALTAVRDPYAVYDLLRAAGLPAPRVLHTNPTRQRGVPLAGASGWCDAREGEVSTPWLVKALRGSSGSGIRFHHPEDKGRCPARSYLQEYVNGESRAAVFVAGPWSTRLLGVTRQLVGEPWLHAEPFHYCGSVGPLTLSMTERVALERLGDVLAAGCKLRGLFGADGIWRGGEFWPVEVNPRYTASVEVLEYATGMSALAWHRAAFDPTTPEPPEVPAEPDGVIGKAIYFAKESLTFPGDGPWVDALNKEKCDEMPDFADIPNPGQQIEARRPVMTVFARGADVSSCIVALRRKAAVVTTGMRSEPEA